MYDKVTDDMVEASLKLALWSKDPELEYFLADLVKAAEAYIAALHCPANPPMEVRRAIVKKFINDLPTGRSVLARLVSYGSYYGFSHTGMFHGVEPDGYIHT